MMLPQLSKVGDQEKKDYRRGRSWPPTQNPNCPGPARPGTPAHSWSDSAANLPFHPADPDWASYKLGIFICLHCSGVHRNFPDVSKVKSVRLDFWDDSMVEVEWRTYADSWNWAWGEEAGRRCCSYSTEEEMKPKEVQ